MDDALVLKNKKGKTIVVEVLILVVMDDALVPASKLVTDLLAKCLNPCCNG